MNIGWIPLESAPDIAVHLLHHRIAGICCLAGGQVAVAANLQIDGKKGMDIHN